MAPKKFSFYIVIVLLLMLVLPLGSILVEIVLQKNAFGWSLAGKWFLFWAVGMRLFTAGIRQVSKPAFTAREIFRIQSEDAFVIVKELGFANICLGLIAIVSLFKPDWRIPSGVAGGMYFGFAGVTHLFKKIDSLNEAVALISDLFIFTVMLLYVIFTV